MGDGVEISVNESNKEVEKVLDTPDRSKNNQIAASVTKTEESPVFNFLNNLSPIKPVKSIYMSQTINPLNFASVPSVFTSPHLTSLKESRILRRHQLPDPSKPEFASNNEIIAQTSDVKARESDVEISGETPFDCSQFVVEYSENPGYKAENNADLALRVPESSQMDKEERNRIDQNTEVPSCDWASLISDALMFDSPTDTDSYRKSMDPELSYYANLQNEMHNIQSLCSVVSNDHLGYDTEKENLSTQPGEGNEIAEAQEASTRYSANNGCEEMDYELSGLYRRMRRRCLVFEMGGGLRKHLEENFGSDSSLLQPETVALNTEDSSSHRILPGIGLHLNALATTSKDYRIVSHDSSSSGRLVIGPGSSVNIHSSTSNQEMLNVETENAIVAVEDPCQASGYLGTEDIKQSSPKKKRRRGEQTGDGEGCKRCNCKKSKCLKLYCECFAAGVYCVELCACVDCFNKPVHEDTVLATRKQIESRNPLAFAPKVIRGSDQQSETVDDSSKTPASARHKRGCNCKKSGCLKKYCECYQGGVGCSINCRCEGCKNAFGRKDGSHVTGLEADIEEDETDGVEKELDSATTPATPLRGIRQPLHLPFSSNKKPPRSSLSSAQSVLGKRSFQSQTTKLDHQLETVKEDEMPGFLQESSAQCYGIKSLSPNGKRVSPPHNSTGLRSSRKLILQSIPSFPSLTQNQ